MKKSNGIFHQETNYHRSRLGVCSTLLFILFMFPVIIVEYLSLGVELGTSNYLIINKEEIEGIELIKPDENMYQRTDFEKDDYGLWPMYIYN